MKSFSFKDLTNAVLPEVVGIRYESNDQGTWDALARREIRERDRIALGLITEKLLYYKTQRANEATIWARAIYPLLALAERGDIRAFSAVSLAARFDGIEIRGEVDGALAVSLNEDPGLPYLVVVEAKRGIGASDPAPQLLGAMLSAAWLNHQAGRPLPEIYGCYTVADVWTFIRGRVTWTEPKPTMSILGSREYTEKTEASTILAILESIVAQAEG